MKIIFKLEEVDLSCDSLSGGQLADIVDHIAVNFPMVYEMIYEKDRDHYACDYCGGPGQSHCFNCEPYPM